MQRIRYRELIGKKVVEAEGKSVGRLEELVAQRQGQQLKVVALRVGPLALIERLGIKPLLRVKIDPPLEIPWKLVDRIEKKALHLKLKRADLKLYQKTKRPQEEEREQQ